VSQPADLPRRLSKHGNGIDALYELTAGIDHKVDVLGERVDTLATRVDQGFEQMSTMFAGLIRELRER